MPSRYGIESSIWPIFRPRNCIKCRVPAVTEYRPSSRDTPYRCSCRSYPSSTIAVVGTMRTTRGICRGWYGSRPAGTLTMTTKTRRWPTRREEKTAKTAMTRKRWRAARRRKWRTLMPTACPSAGTTTSEWSSRRSPRTYRARRSYVGRFKSTRTTTCTTSRNPPEPTSSSSRTGRESRWAPTRSARRGLSSSIKPGGWGKWACRLRRRRGSRTRWLPPTTIRSRNRSRYWTRTKTRMISKIYRWSKSTS
mmetsp:Transcript_4738/g.13372  ORF Transcript_4738/g.13372 Transcript_4738/m.13372 type:complete len:250 (-) Transcript_4738:687-1436(-)